MDGTAALVTGAAAIMVAVFLAFAAGVVNARQLGVGLAIAGALDATIVRPCCCLPRCGSAAVGRGGCLRHSWLLGTLESFS